jgi:hypothetical protein
VDKRDNHIYIGETDFDLRITRFIKCEDAASYRIDYGVLDASSKKTFAIGDYSIIPYWIGGVAMALSGGVSLNDFDQKFDSLFLPDSVVADLRRIISNSRTGYYRKLVEDEESDALSREYRDIFDEYPVNSRYWISRYRSAVLRTTGLAGKNAVRNKHELHNRALEWIKNFRYKGNFRLMLELLRSSDRVIMEREEVRLILFVCIVNALKNFQSSWLKRNEIREIISEYFPNGIFQFYNWERNEIAQVLKENADLGYEALWVGSHFDFIGCVEEFLHDDIIFRLDMLLCICMIIFGNVDPPPDIAQWLYDYYRGYLNDVNSKIHIAFNRYFRNREISEQWPRIANEILSSIEKLNLLIRIRLGEFRLRASLPPDHQAIESRVVAELRRYAKGDD